MMLDAAIIILPLSRRGGTPKLGGHLRREERQLPRGVLARVGRVDDMSELIFRMLPPPCSGTTGFAHEQVGPTRPPQAHQTD
jgi:hypothetical protein